MPVSRANEAFNLRLLFADRRTDRAIQRHFSTQIASLRFWTSDGSGHLCTATRVCMQRIDSSSYEEVLFQWKILPWTATWSQISQTKQDCTGYAESWCRTRSGSLPIPTNWVDETCSLALTKTLWTRTWQECTTRTNIPSRGLQYADCLTPVGIASSAIDKVANCCSNKFWRRTSVLSNIVSSQWHTAVKEENVVPNTVSLISFSQHQYRGRNEDAPIKQTKLCDYFTNYNRNRAVLNIPRV